MRQILFKAKRVDNGEWVQGNLFVEGNRAEITRGTCNGVGIEGVSVDKDTICQYTGLTDYDGNKIWENDIIRLHDFTSEDYIVIWNKDMGAYVICNAITKLVSIDLVGDCIQEIPYVEVIGNVFDSPGLLKGE